MQGETRNPYEKRNQLLKTCLEVTLVILLVMLIAKRKRSVI